MKLSKTALAAAPLCATCYDYVDDCKVVLRQRGWVHVSNNSRRCPGQGNDDTEDYAMPMTWPDNGQRLVGRHYVVGLDDRGHEVLGGRVTAENYYGTEA